MGPVRLEGTELAVIITTICELCSDLNLVRIAIFGSRADLSKRGGDLDILVEYSGRFEDPRAVASRIRVTLWEKMGEQKIDILVYNIDRSLNDEQTNLFFDIVNPQSSTIWRKP